MNKYSLILDESGNFKEKSKTADPSIVAGLLIEGDFPSETYARNYLAKIKKKSSDYEPINIKPFHAMEERSPFKTAFMTDLLRGLTKDGFRIVSFVNQKGIVIVNSDITYLNVFANGVLALIRDLLKLSTDKISLNILYAHRQEDLARENYDMRIRIEQNEYEHRIMERLGLLVAKLPPFDQQRIGRRVTLRTDNAKKNAVLMLADAVCFALRGGNQSFSKEQRDCIKELPQYYYIVPEKETWGIIQDHILQNHYAEAIYLWYGGMKDELSQYKQDFNRIMIEYFTSVESPEILTVTTVLSQYLTQLINQRRFELANRFLAGLNDEFIPLMREQGIGFERLYFDLHFQRLTTATHQGDYQAEKKEIRICREELKKFPPTYETLDYFLRYKIREIEHLKNCYDFRQALQELDNLEKILTNMVDLIQMIDELGDYASGLTSSTLGRVYGSRIMTRYFLGLTEPEQFDLARADFEKAIDQLTEVADQRRDCQMRAAVEYLSGHYEDAIRYLSNAFMDDETTDYKKVLKAILYDSSAPNRLFGLMHYATAMARAMLEKSTIGEDMFEAWLANKIEFPGNDDAYPVCIILWRQATCAAIQGMRHARGWYERAINAAMNNPQAYANVASGLVIQFERLALEPYHFDLKYAKLEKDYSAFMAEDIPDTMHEYFIALRSILDGLSAEKIQVNKDEICDKLKGIPIL